MKEHIDLIDKAIKEKLDGHEAPVPEHLWNSIESILALENENNKSGSFFRNPFMISILIISTIIIGTYIYHSSNDQPIESSTQLNKTNTATDALNISASTYSTGNTYNESASEEKNQNTNTISSIDIEKENPTNVYVSDIRTEKTSNTPISKNKYSTITPDHKTIQHPSNTTSNNKSQAKNNDLSQRNNNSVLNKNTLQNSTVTNKTNAVIKAKTTSFTDPSLDNLLKKGNKNKTNHSSLDFFTRSNQSDSTHATTPSVNKTVQGSSITDLRKNIFIAPYADSIHRYAAVFLQEFNSPNNTIQTTNLNIPLAYKSPTKNVLANNTSTSASNQAAHLNTSQINSALLSLNSNNTLTKTSEIKFLYNQHILTTDQSSFDSKNQTLNSNSNTNTLLTSLTSRNKEFEDTIYDRNSLKNYFHEYLQSNNENNSSSSINNEFIHSLILQVDSAMLVKQIDSSVLENSPETIEVKSSIKEAKKKSLFLSRCSFDGYATPALGYLHLSANNQEAANGFIENRNKNTNAGFGITTGMRMNYALTQKIEIGIGIQYSSLSQHSSLSQQDLDSSYYSYQGYNKKDSIFDQQTQQTIDTTYFVVTDSSRINTYSIHIIKQIDKYQNISIPIHIAYGYSISNKLSLLARTVSS